MCGRCQLRRAIALQQHRVGEAADPRDVGTRRRGHLLDGRARTDLGLNFFGAQHVGDVDLEVRLLRLCGLAVQRGPQSLVGRQPELLCGFISLADDVFAVGIEPNHFEFPHGVLLAGSVQVSDGPVTCAL
jgi:hypothetical protein